jgi:transposase InsO family protein
MCQVLNVTRSGYYAWSQRPPSQRSQTNQALVALIRQVFQTSRSTYGSPRLHAYLRRQGVRCGHNRVARLMRLHGMVARKRQHRYPVTTQRQPGAVPAPNLLQGNFSAERPNQKWVSDITYLDTAEGWFLRSGVYRGFVLPQGGRLGHV